MGADDDQDGATGSGPFPLDEARRLGLTDEQIAREVLQAQILSALFAGQARKALARENLLVLKGGLAMRQGYGSRRMTKDIDLSASPEAPKAAVAGPVRRALDAAVRASRLEDVRISEPKQTDTVQRWKLNGRLADSATTIQLTVEVSKRSATPPELVADVLVRPDPVYGIRPAIVRALRPIALAAGKVAALCDPRRVAPRDVYDLDVLVEKSVDSPAALLARQGVEEIRRALEAIWAKLDGMEHGQAVVELRDFLPVEAMRALTEEEWTLMRMRVGGAVESWLEEAEAIARQDEGGP